MENKKIIESILVALFMLVLVVSLSALVVSAGSTIKTVSRNKEVDKNVRVARTYVNTKIRQNDKRNTITIKKNAINDKDSVKITNLVSDEEKDTWIFLDDNKLYECMITKGETPSIKQSTVITELKTFDVAFNNNSINFTLGDSDGNYKKVEDVNIYMRSEQFK